MTKEGEKIVLLENISKYVTDKRDDFCKAIINKLINFSFENIFNEKFDFYATIFEYLIKDYNTNSEENMPNILPLTLSLKLWRDVL